MILTTIRVNGRIEYACAGWRRRGDDSLADAIDLAVLKGYMPRWG